MRYGAQGATLSEPLFDTKDFDNNEILLNRTSNGHYGSYNLINESHNYDSLFDSSQPDFIRHVPSSRNLQDLERITRYIQSLPDVGSKPQSPIDGFNGIFDNYDNEAEDDDEDNDGPNSPAAAPPPPAPPDPNSNEQQQLQKQQQQLIDTHEPTAGEKIFKALKTVTSQSYIDASEFYKYVYRLFLPYDIE